MNIETALTKLFSLHTFGIKLGLDNIQKFLDKLDNPQKKLKTFHVAGSNGKGSTSAFMASMLTELGYKVGLYTSPHFVRFNERILINSYEIPDNYVAEFITDNWDYIDKNELTFFEVTTALAFLYFYEQKVDFAIIETGLGGRLDATNVLNPLAVLITSISLEHTNILGNSVREIAGEKAAIIKNNIKVFTGKLPAEADELILKKCNETSSELFRLEEYIIEKENSLVLYTEEVELDDWAMPLKGNYQKYNAALAGLAVTKTLNIEDYNSIKLGINNVIKNTNFQGRFEYYSTQPDIIFESAHNPDGIKNFLSEFKKGAQKYDKRVLLFGVMRDKSIKEMLIMLMDAFDEIHITQINIERTATINELSAFCTELNINYVPEPNSGKFVLSFLNSGKQNCLVVLGSMYLLGEIKSLLRS